MLLALKAVIAITCTQLTITLAENHTLRKQLRKYRVSGMVMTEKLKQEDLTRLRKVLEDLPAGLLSHDNCMNLIINSGCTKTSTGFLDDFVPGTLVQLDQPIAMQELLAV